MKKEFDLDKLLCVISGQLQVLEVQYSTFGEEQICAVSRHCVGLSELVLNHFMFSADSAVMWRAVGPSLTEVTIDPNDDDASWDMHLGYIRDFCPCLEKIRIMALVHYEEMGIVTELCTGIGSNLLHLRMIECHITPEFGVLLRQKCPNASIETTVEDSEGAFLAEIGPQAESLIVRNAMKYNSVLRKALLTCTNLSRITLRYCEETAGFLEDLFKTPKRQLSHIFVVFYNDRGWAFNFPSVLDVLSRHTMGLKHIHFDCEYLPPDAFCGLVAANPSIEFVRIRFLNCTKPDDTKDFTAEECLAGVVKAFARCPALQELHVIEKGKPDKGPLYPLVQAACGRLRHRRVAVGVCNRYYLH